jgi:uncharacterized phage protein gp47/JayE
MKLQLQDFPTLVRGMAAGVQGASSALVDLTVGSTLRAVLEANASLALWLQWLIVQVLSTTRAATSAGSDLDSWMADYSVTRLPAVAATGSVTFARFTTGLAALIPVGTQVRSTDGSQSFAVTADTTNAAYNAGANGYAVAAAAGSVTVPVAAVTPGAAGNVQAGGITVLAAAIPGIDTVSNASAFTNGMDAESDAALRGRFQNWAASLSRATPVAVQAAAASVQQNVQTALAESVDTAGNPRAASFVLTVDDGTGAPSAALLASVATAVETMRPVGVTYAVQPPVVVGVSIGLTLAVSGSNKAALIGPVASAIQGFVNTLPIGATLPFSRIATLAYAVDPGIVNVTGVLVNGATRDVVPPWNGVVKATSVTVS